MKLFRGSGLSWIDGKVNEQRLKKVVSWKSGKGKGKRGSKKKKEKREYVIKCE